MILPLSERFRLLPDAEIAIESDPRTLADAMIQQIGLLGFNRASFGVQEFDPNVHAAINRIQPPEMVERATCCAEPSSYASQWSQTALRCSAMRTCHGSQRISA